MLECFYCHKPHNTQNITGHRMHETCRHLAALIIQSELVSRHDTSISDKAALHIVEQLCEAMEQAEK